jgi:hypothetical protein
MYGTRQEVETEIGSEGNDDSDDTEIDPNDINCHRWLQVAVGWTGLMRGGGKHTSKGRWRS